MKRFFNSIKKIIPLIGMMMIPVLTILLFGMKMSGSAIPWSLVMLPFFLFGVFAKVILMMIIAIAHDEEIRTLSLKDFFRSTQP